MVYPILIVAISDKSKWPASALGIYRFWRDLAYAAAALCTFLLLGQGNMVQLLILLIALLIKAQAIVQLYYFEKNKPEKHKTQNNSY